MFSVDQIALFIQALMPGAIAVYVRDRFVQRPKMPFAELAPAYVVISALYFGTLFLIIDPGMVFGDMKHGINGRIVDLAIFFNGPAAFGLLIGVLGQLRLPERLATFLPITFIDPHPTAWDFKFGGMRRDEYVNVLLKNGETIVGYFGARSHAASDPGRRDLYIETTYREGADGAMTTAESVGVWISGQEIVKIEFRPYIEGAATLEEETRS